MAETTTITVRVPLDVKDKLDRLAELTDRSRSFHTAAALADYARSELEIVEAITRGLADSKAGRGTPHKQAMAELRGEIARVASKAKKRSA